MYSLVRRLHELNERQTRVIYSEEGLNLRRSILGTCWPTQAFLGPTSHTHPYLNLKEVTNDTELYLEASDTPTEWKGMSKN